MNDKDSAQNPLEGCLDPSSRASASSTQNRAEPAEEDASSPTSDTRPSSLSSEPAGVTIESFFKRFSQLCSLEHLSDDESLTCESCKEESKRWQQRLTREWKYTGTMLTGLFAIEITVFGFQSAGIISTMNATARNCVALASLITSLELVHLFWLSFRYTGVDPRVFAERARDLNGSYFFFSFKSRLPTVAAVITLVTMVIFTVAVIEEEWKSTAITTSILFLALLGSEYIFTMVRWAAKAVYWLSGYLLPNTKDGVPVSWLFSLRFCLFSGVAHGWPMIRGIIRSDEHRALAYQREIVSQGTGIVLIALLTALVIIKRRFPWRTVRDHPALAALTSLINDFPDLAFASWIILGLIGWSKKSDRDVGYIAAHSVLLGVLVGLVALEKVWVWKERRSMRGERRERTSLFGGVEV